MRLFYLFILSISILFGTLEARDKREFVLLTCRYEQGLFSAADTVLSALRSYERHEIKGLIVYFDKDGCYYSQEHGRNWWSYYFEPIMVGELQGHMKRSIDWGSYDSISGISKTEAHYIISKHIKANAEIQERLTAFTRLYFDGHYVIGVHYRGTDKITEHRRIAYEDVRSMVQAQTNVNPSAKIFVATDEQNFIDYMQECFPGKIIYNHDALRSKDGKPLHMAHYDRYKAGLDAVMDCLLLSKTDLMIRTSSNLNRWATYFSPNLPTIDLY